MVIGHANTFDAISKTVINGDQTAEMRVQLLLLSPPSTGSVGAPTKDSISHVLSTLGRSKDATD